MPETSFEKLQSELRNGPIDDMGDTRFNRLIQAAESERRERLVNALEGLIYEVRDVFRSVTKALVSEGILEEDG